MIIIQKVHFGDPNSLESDSQVVKHQLQGRPLIADHAVAVHVETVLCHVEVFLALCVGTQFQKQGTGYEHISIMQNLQIIEIKRV